MPNPPKLEPEKRRVIFQHEPIFAQNSKADLILVVNESLQKAGILVYTRFSRVGYLQLRAISALLTEKSSAKNLVRNHFNILIRTAKSVNEKIIGIEALERWQSLKIHGMSLAQYLGDRKIELLRQEIKLSTGIQLKTMPRGLISETQLEKCLESGTRKSLAVVITVENSTEASKLCSKGLRFGGALKMVKKYWKAGPGLVCMSYAGVGHNCLGEYRKKAIKCVICASAHKVKNHRYGITGCTIKMDKIYTHVTPKYANCRENHQAIAFKCPTRLRAQAEV